LVGCGQANERVPTDASIAEPSAQTGGEHVSSLNMKVGSRGFTITLYDNASVQALLAKMPLTINMSELNGNEKYYNLPDKLPADPQRAGCIFRK